MKGVSWEYQLCGGAWGGVERAERQARELFLQFTHSAVKIMVGN